MKARKHFRMLDKTSNHSCNETVWVKYYMGFYFIPIWISLFEQWELQLRVSHLSRTNQTLINQFATVNSVILEHMKGAFTTWCMMNTT